MAEIDQYLSGNVRSTKFFGSAVPGGFNGDGSLLTSLTRANIAASSANHVIINGAAGLLGSEATLATSRGGHGPTSGVYVPPYTYWNNFVGNVRPTDSIAVDALLPAIQGADVGVFNPLAASAASIGGTVVIRDASGSIVGGGITQTVTSATTINISGPSTSYISTAYARTAPGATSTLFTIVPSAFTGVYSVEAIISLSKLNTTTYGSIRVLAKAVYNVGTATWTTPVPVIEYHASIDAGISAATVSVTSVAGNLLLRVVGVAGAGNTIDWTGQARIVYQRMLVV